MTIFFILLGALLVRLFALNQSLWLDEATSALASKMSLNDLFTKFLPGDFHPPLYYLLLKYWISIFGSSEISLRIPSIIFGLGTVYMIYLIGKKLFDEKIGLIAAILLATSGLAVYYSQEARMYSLAAFLVSLAVYLFIQKKWILFSLIMILVGMNDYVSLLIIPALFIVSGKDWKKFIYSLIPFVAVFAVWLPTFLTQLRGGLSIAGSAWWKILGLPTLKNAALIPIKFILGRISFDNNFVYGLVIAFVFVIFGFLFFKALRSSKLLWSWLLTSVILGIILSFKIPTLTYFRFLFALPAFYLLASYGLSHLPKKIFKLGIGLVIAINILTTGYYLFNPVFQREDWRSAAKAIGNDPIVFPENSHEEAMIYYGKGGQIESVNDIETSQRVIWLSRYVQEITDPADSTRNRIESLGYKKAGEYNWGGVVFWKYSKTQYAYLY